VDSISPDSAPNTGSISATVSGSNFQAGAQVSLRKTGEPVIEATGEAVTATSITCTLNLTGVAPGGWDVVVRNPDGREDALTDGFNVINPGDFTVTSITPNRGKVGTVVNITNLAGAGFQAGATVRLELGGTVIDATDVNVLSGTLITCKFNLAGAPLGFYDVVVQNPDGMEVRLTRGFEVYECGPAAGMAALMLGLMMGLLAMADNRRRGRVKSWLKRRARLLTSITIILAMSALLAFAPSLGGVERFAGSTTAEAAAIENVYYYHNDHLGTPMAMTDADRNVVWRANYRPFGESQDQSGDLDNTQRFTGKRYDEDIGLYCFGTRHYDPKTARFTSTDPIFHKDNSLQFMNFYSYVVNNPYRMIDPSGNMPTWSQVTKSIDAFANRVSKMHPMAQFAVGMGVVIGLTIGTVAVCVGGAYVVGIAAGAVTVGGIGVAEFTALTHGTAQIADVLCLSLNGTTIASAFTGAELTVGTLATAWGVSEATATLAVFLAVAALLGYSIKDACEKFGITNEQLEEAKKALKDLKGKSPTSEDKSAETDKTTKEVKKAPSGTAPPVKGENKKK
jgi:RHS repeat-associated protein